MNSKRLPYQPGRGRRGRVQGRGPVSAIVLVLLFIALALVWAPRWRYYPPVTSPEALTLIKLLYTACNTRDAGKLDDVESRVQVLVESKSISAAERKSFEQIIAQARRGAWDAAQRNSLRFAEDQLGRGSPRSPPEAP